MGASTDDCGPRRALGPAAGFSVLRSFRQPLVTPRLRLRGLDASDIPAVAAACNDWAVAPRLSQVPFPYGADDARFFVEMIAPQQLVWGIEDSATGTLIGAIGLSPLADPLRAELGYWLGSGHWGKGYASEAGEAVCAFARGLACLTALESGYFADNPASGRVQAKLGFIETHRSVRPCRARNTDLPSIETRLLFAQPKDQPERSNPTAASRSNR